MHLLKRFYFITDLVIRRGFWGALVRGFWGALVRDGAYAGEIFFSSSPEAPHPTAGSGSPSSSLWLHANNRAMTWIRGDSGFVVKADFLQGGFYIKGVIVITPRFGTFHQYK